jgi:hypothetical protein
MINCSELVNKLADIKGVEVTEEVIRSYNIDSTEMLKNLNDAKFNKAAIKWINYYPDIHFSNSIVTQFIDLVGANGSHRAWVSRIDPGYAAPWHWDADEKERDYLKKGPITRYTLFLKDFAPGQIFVLDKDIIVQAKEGEVIKWKSHALWHSAANVSLVPNWMIHLVAY